MVTQTALHEIAKMLPTNSTHKNLYPIYQRGYRVNQEMRLRQNVEIPIQTWMRQLLERATGEDPNPTLLSKAVEVIARHRGANAVAFKDAKSSLERLSRRNLRLGVISNISSHEVALQIIKHVGLDKYFEQVTTSALVAVRKPDPGIFRYALFQFGLQPEEAVHVGDSEAMDAEGAKVAGLRTILVSRKPGKKSIADYQVSSLKEVADLVAPRKDRQSHSCEAQHHRER